MKHATAFALIHVLGSGLALASPVKLEAIASPLEGSRFEVKVTPNEWAAQNGEKSSDDTLEFEGGRVSMGGSVRSGFYASPYSLTISGSVWAFRTEQYSKKEGRSEWTGEIREDSIKGELTRTKKDGTVLHFTFDGKKVSR